MVLVFIFGVIVTLFIITIILIILSHIQIEIDNLEISNISNDSNTKKTFSIRNNIR